MQISPGTKWKTTTHNFSSKCPRGLYSSFPKIDRLHAIVVHCFFFFFFGFHLNKGGSLNRPTTRFSRWAFRQCVRAPVCVCMLENFHCRCVMAIVVNSWESFSLYLQTFQTKTVKLEKRFTALLIETKRKTFFSVGRLLFVVL